MPARRLLTLRGELDIVSAPDLRAALDELPDDVDVVLDVGSVTFVDSVALGVLVAAAAAHGRAGSRLVLLDPAPPVTRVLQLTGLDRLLPQVSGAGGLEAAQPRDIR